MTYSEIEKTAPVGLLKTTPGKTVTYTKIATT